MSRYIKVKFKDGSYGIRVNNLFSWMCEPRFVDLTNARLEWHLESRWFRDCRGTKSQIDLIFESLTDYGTPV